MNTNLLVRLSTLVLNSALLIFPAFGPGSALAAAADAAVAQPESKEQRDQRLSWFRDARFGMFIHWGVYSVPAGEWNGNTNYGEWFLESTKMPVSQYEIYADAFNPVKFEAKEWVRVAKDAGMKYIVITTKHHDGFGMFRSDLTDWCLKSTPFQRDPMKELAAACQTAGLKLCFYHSIMDWHHPDYGARRAWNDKATGTPNMDRYTDFMKGQLKELLTGYGPIGILWFDGEWEGVWTHERGEDLYRYVRSLQPNIIINNRVGKAAAGGATTNRQERIGDYGTPEQTIPPKGYGPGVDWESCMTMNRHWGYNKHDQNWKSTERLIRNLIDCASKGGNYLLNVGPTSQGLFPEPCVDRLRQIGQWIKVNGEAIYGTGPTPFGNEAGSFSETEKTRDGKPRFKPAWEWRCTTKPGKLYIHIFNWPATAFELTGVTGKITNAYLLADPRRAALKVSQSGAKVSVALPKQAPDPIASVLCLELQGG